MNKFYLFYIFIFINIAWAQPLTIKVSYEDKQTYPFVMEDGTSINPTLPGLTIELLQQLQEQLNVTFEFKREQGIRGQKNLQANNVDMLLFLSYKPQREEIGVFPKTSSGEIDTSLKAMDLSYVLYTLKDSKLDWDGEKFLNVNGSIGATKGYSIVSFLKEHGLKVSENTSNLGDPRKLLAKRIQGFANQESKIDPYLKQHAKYDAKIKKIYPPLKTKPYYILFSKQFFQNNKELAYIIWELTSDHINNSKYQDLIRKYK